MEPPGRAGRPRVATALGVSGCAVVALAIALDAGRLDDDLTLVLAAGAVLAALLVVHDEGPIKVSASFLCATVAIGFLGIGPALAVLVVAEVTVWLAERYVRPLVGRYRLSALAMNIACLGVPAAIVGSGFRALELEPSESAFPAALGATALLYLLLNFAATNALFALRDGRQIGEAVRLRRIPYASMLLNGAAAVAVAEVYDSTGIAALSLLVLIATGFSYMTRLVFEARTRAREYANLSWGVLSGLIRTLDERDKPAARHCAAVAKFSRDIAKQVGMSEREQELAHTAGLLHDIGRFALSDRVMEKGITLTEDDWRSIRRHPEIGADLLRDIGVYGPVSEIIIAHHERIDGKGYPKRLTGDEIPEISKIIAVAEVYDTLTAPDTYRTQHSSFEALTELRRVAGTQLESRYVEALAELLAGQGIEYRLADDADYDVELDIERRMNEAAAP